MRRGYRGNMEVIGFRQVWLETLMRIGVMLIKISIMRRITRKIIHFMINNNKMNQDICGTRGKTQFLISVTQKIQLIVTEQEISTNQAHRRHFYSQ